MPPSLDWCRDIDYGSLPQWLTLGLALVVGYFTIRGVRTAVKSYEISRQAFADDVRNREVSQARLVYGHLENGWPLPANGSILVPVKGRKTHKVLESVGVSPPKRWAATNGEMQMDGNKEEDLRVYQFRVFNNSDQPISHVSVRIDGVNVTTRPGALFFDVMAPKSSFGRTVVSSDTRVPKEIDLTFRDSAGIEWHRYGSGPVIKALAEGWIPARMGLLARMGREWRIRKRLRRKPSSPRTLDG